MYLRNMKQQVAEKLQDVGIKAISIHGRTRKQMYKGHANWDLIAKVKSNPRMHIPIFGNGDVDSPEKAEIMKNQYGLDGAMIGRAAIGNPWIFNEIKHYFCTGEKLEKPNIKEKIKICKQHLIHSIDWKGENLGIAEMKRHYPNYFRGIPNFKPFRIKLVTSESLNEILDTLDEISKIFIDH